MLMINVHDIDLLPHPIYTSGMRMCPDIAIFYLRDFYTPFSDEMCLHAPFTAARPVRPQVTET